MTKMLNETIYKTPAEQLAETLRGLSFPHKEEPISEDYEQLNYRAETRRLIREVVSMNQQVYANTLVFLENLKAEAEKDKDFSKKKIAEVSQTIADFSEKVASQIKILDVFSKKNDEGIVQLKEKLHGIAQQIGKKTKYSDILDTPQILQKDEIRRLIVDFFQTQRKLQTKEQKTPQTKKEAKSSTGSDWLMFGGYDYAPTLTKKIVSVTADYPAASIDNVVLVNATSGNITVTLPPATKKGHNLLVKKTDSSANTVTITRGGSDTIEGDTSVVLTAQYASRELVADGATTWYINASGTGGGGTIEVPSGTIDGSNTTFTVNNTPKYVIVDGLYRRSGKGYTYASGTITVDPLTPPNYDIFSIY